MDFPIVATPGLPLNPLALSPNRGAAAQNLASGSVVPAATATDVLATLLAQSLSLTGGDASFAPSFQAALQTSTTLPSPLAASSLSNVTQATLAQGPTSLTPLLLQTLNSDDLSNTPGEIPFVAPYQLGLQAIQSLAPPVQTPGQADLALSNAAQPDASQNQALTTATPTDLLQTLTITPATTADAQTLGIADPTSSALFQSLSGALAPNPLLASATLNSGLTETTSLRVMETNASAATSAFSEGQALNSNAFEKGSPARERLSTSPSPGSLATEGIDAVYSPQGMATAYRARIGTLLDSNG